MKRRRRTYLYMILLIMTWFLYLYVNWTESSTELIQSGDFADSRELTPYDFSEIVDSEDTREPVQVIIVTTMRSGSSFTRELFNRNNRFVYYFEPFNEIKLNIKDKTAGFAGTSYQSILKGLLHCDFSNFTGFNWWNGRRPRQQCAYSLAYQPTSLCVSSSGIIQPFKFTISDSEKNTVNEKTCKSRPHIAIKTVRLYEDIGILKELAEDPSLNVKIIHLVRDPRAVSNSRQDIHDPDDPTRECRHIGHNLKNYWINPPAWIQGRYMLLRYEDLAERPHYIMDKVYKFVLNTSAPSSLKNWFVENTQLPQPSPSTGLKWPWQWTFGLKTKRDKYSHTRDSAKTAHSWRTELRIKFDKVLEAQRGCQKVMRLLGYKPVLSQAHLKNLKYPTLERFSYPFLPNRTITV